MKSLHVYLCLILTASALYSSSSPVIKLTEANFQTEVMESEDMWMVEFFAPWCGHCKKLAPEWEKAAKSLQGTVKVGAVDMTTDGKVGEPYDVKGFPTLKFFGKDKSQPISYNGARTAKEIVEFAKRQAESGGVEEEPPKEEKNEEEEVMLPEEKDVIFLVTSNFTELVLESEEMWFVDWFAPWCDHCKMMRRDWARLAHSLRGVLKVAKIKANEERTLADEQGVKGYPTIMVYPPGDRSQKYVYDGARDFDSLYIFINKELNKYSIPPKIRQITDYASFNDTCPEGETRVCVIAFLPHIYDATANDRERYLATIVKAAVDHRTEPFAWMWAQAGDHPKLEQQFGIGFGYPTVLTLNRFKSKFSVMKATFSPGEFSKYLTKMMRGRVALSDYKTLEAFGNVQPWDGKDATPPDESPELIEEIEAPADSQQVEAERKKEDL